MNLFSKAYLGLGSVVCMWFLLACLFGWRAPNLGIAAAFSSSGGSTSGGRSSGGYWGGGK